jgi:hypothetical protein
MSKEYWREVLETARDTLAQLRVRRDELDAEREEVNLEIVQLEQVVTNLTPLVSEPPQDTLIYHVATRAMPANLANACREILKSSNRYLTPIEIRNALEASAYDLSQHANALASIHGVLKRMAESGEIETLTHDIKGTMYSWKPQSAGRANSSPLREAAEQARRDALIQAEERDIQALRRRRTATPPKGMSKDPEPVDTPLQRSSTVPERKGRYALPEKESTDMPKLENPFPVRRRMSIKDLKGKDEK